MPANQNLIKQTDQCVMCGLCLPHCPTYLVSLNEGESPRGRISLIKAFAEGQLPASEGLENHLQSCTGCMNCQNVCPANVSYQEIIDQGRELYRTQLNLAERLSQTLSIGLLTHSWGHALIGAASHFKYLVPNQFKTALSHYRSSETSQTHNHSRKVTLFTGCTGNVFDQETLDSVCNILNTLDIEAHIPADVFCCGALAQHSGQTDKAQQQLQHFSDYLNSQENNECVSFASGCGQQLALYAEKYDIQHCDIHDYLAKQLKLGEVSFNALPKNVQVHVPCSLSKTSVNNMFRLLRLIPDIRLMNFNDGLPCCGAGGMQLLNPRQSNQALLDRKIDTIQKAQPDVIVSANIGCTLHLLNGLNESSIEVVHPITLLSRQLKNN